MVLKFRKSLIISALTAGLLLGGTALVNVSTANAADGQGSHRQVMGFQARMGAQGQQNMMFQFARPIQQQPMPQPMRQQFVQQQPMQQPVQQQFMSQQLMQQSVSQQFIQGCQMSGVMGGNIISQVADILDVEEQTIIEALQDGKTLVEIAEDYDLGEDELLSQLEELQTDAIEEAVDDGNLTDEQAEELKDQLAEWLEQIVEGSGIMLNNHISDDTSVSDIEDTLNDYFGDAGDDYFGDDGIDVTTSLDGDEDDLAYTIKLDFDDADDYDDLTEVSTTNIETFLNAVNSRINTEIDDTDYEDADITGKLVDNDDSSYYVKYNGSSYTYSWDD